MTSKITTFLATATVIGGLAFAPLAFAQTNSTPAPGGQAMPNHGMMGGQGSMTGGQGSMGGMNGMMSMMGQMNRMMSNCNRMMDSMNSPSHSGPQKPGTQHSPG